MDTREKLEADMVSWLDENLRTDPYDAGIAYAWLDRQAAIVRRECLETIRECLDVLETLWEFSGQGNGKELK